MAFQGLDFAKLLVVDEAGDVVAALEAGQRTPLTIGVSSAASYFWTCWLRWGANPLGAQSVPDMLLLPSGTV